MRVPIRRWGPQAEAEPEFQLSSLVGPSNNLSTQNNNSMDIDDEIVDFEEDTEVLNRCLIRGIARLDVIPIVGIGGGGGGGKRDLLQEIFSQITGIKDKGDKVDELADMLKKSLMGKRYLIVLDDMWDTIAWDD
ncbi:hypothetical protein CQW23_22509 [Capsicum baccatum]|uniref:NB-ARC domain-containing protein n=1 Tax=Capsicum baccatum TaxID=33114 RepID=A0A2G2W131_CAPBA|nr:hypothetical protein CQW23_22509 [Capsicum baccatum]